MSPMRPKSGKPFFELIIIYFQIVFMNLIILLVEICGYNSYFSDRALFKTVINERLLQKRRYKFQI